MNIFKIFYIIAALYFLFFCAFPVLAVKKVFVPNPSSLQPMPVGVTPDISHNINAHNNQAPLNITENTNQQNQNSPTSFLPNLNIIKNNSNIIIYFLIFTIVIVAVLAFFLFWN